MTVVVKRDGKKEVFDERKIRRSIEAAARDAHLSNENARVLAVDASPNVIEYARNEEQIRTSTIRESLLNRLDTCAPHVSRAWRDFDRRNKGLS